MRPLDYPVQSVCLCRRAMCSEAFVKAATQAKRDKRFAAVAERANRSKCYFYRIPMLGEKADAVFKHLQGGEKRLQASLGTLLDSALHLAKRTALEL